MAVSLVDVMGTDLTVVNAARVSFSKQSEFVINPESGVGELSEKDSKLIKYLATHGHWSPFAHCFMTFRIKAPIFVARQLVKHQVGLSWNEVSRRYVDDEPEFWVPDKWRGRPEGSIKQGSSGEVKLKDETGIYMYLLDCLGTYNDLLAQGVAPEQARMVLPLNTMTEWVWSGSLMAWIRVLKQRLDEHAQEEVREGVAKHIQWYVQQAFPESYKAYFGNQ